MSRRKPTLYEELLRLRDRQRRGARSAGCVIRGSGLPWEKNPQGRFKWYLHPSRKGAAINSLLLFLQELAPGGRSGRQRVQGGAVFFIWSGRGRTVIDGVAHRWSKDDVLQLPIRPEGIEFQHFNDDPRRPARLLCAEPNLLEALGVDRGCGFEQLENAP